MGFESKIIFRLNPQTSDEVREILEQQSDFYKKESIENNLNFEFRENKVDKGLPDVIVSFEEDGLYICQYISSKPWDGINALTTYFNEKNLDFKIEEI